MAAFRDHLREYIRELGPFPWVLTVAYPAAWWFSDYLGAHPQAAGRVLGSFAAIGVAYLVSAWLERRQTHLRVGLSIDVRSMSRLWIADGGYEADVSAAIIGAADKWKARWAAAEGNERLKRRMRRHERWLIPKTYYRFMFLGSPANPTILVWDSDRKDFVGSNLVYEKLWKRLLTGTGLQEREPNFIVELRHWSRPRLLRIYLGSVPTFRGETRPEQTLCEFPIELLLPIRSRREKELLARYGLDRRGGDLGSVVYEHKWFKFTVDVARLGDSVAV